MSPSLTMRVVRPTLIVIGCLMAAFGVIKLLDNGQVWQVAPWAIGPVIVHDALFAPLVAVGGWLASRSLPTYAKSPVLTGAMVTAGLLLVATSVITRPGALSDNPSLLDRNYALGLFIALLVVWGSVGTWIVVARAKHRGAGEATVEP